MALEAARLQALAAGQASSEPTKKRMALDPRLFDELARALAARTAGP
jgi:hypothetical protein